MLFNGGFDSAISLFLLGLAFTAVITVAGVTATSDNRAQLPRRVGMQLLYAGCFVPSIIFGLNFLPKHVSPRSLGWLAVVPLSTLGAYLIYREIFHRPVPRVFDERPAVPPTPRAVASYTLVNTSISEYKEVISEAEMQASDIAYIQSRIAPYFLSDATLNWIAKERFGEGSSSIEVYVQQHQHRRRAFHSYLARGCKYREIYPRQRLIDYVSSGTHAEGMWPLSPKQITDTLNRWADTLEQYPNYFVGVSVSSIPIKYHLIDRKLLILHEPVGSGETVRLNSIMTYSDDVGSVVNADFEQIWEDIPLLWRDRAQLINWVRTDLVQLAQSRVDVAARADTEHARRQQQTEPAPRGGRPNEARPAPRKPKQ